jgi:hypothetical protein
MDFRSALGRKKTAQRHSRAQSAELAAPNHGFHRQILSTQAKNADRALKPQEFCKRLGALVLWDDAALIEGREANYVARPPGARG